MGLIKKAAVYFARKEFCRSAIQECTNWSTLKKHHTLPVLTGMVLIVMSFVLVVPSFLIVGFLAIQMKQPVIGVIGIPLAYGLSWLMLVLGMYLTGPDYAKVLGKWFIRIVLEKILGDEAKKIALNLNEDAK